MWANHGHAVQLFGKNPLRIEELRIRRENVPYLRGITLPPEIGLTNDLRDCGEADLLLFVMRSTALRETVASLRKVSIRSDAVLLSCIKGVEHGTGKRMSEIIRETFPQHTIAVLSGPNLAAEVSRDLPTATVLACTKQDKVVELQRVLGTPRFRVYTSNDLVGVELGGALKNVFAIAAGAGDGLRLGDNSKAALVTRALAEMVRLGTKMGGELRTFYGLSGAGDLIATCFSQHSRNRRTGEQLAKGRSLEEIASLTGTVAEGIPTTQSAYECARKLQVDTPIIDQVYSLLYQQKPPARAMEELMGRDQKAEII